MKKILYALLLLGTVYSCQDNLIDGGIHSTAPLKITTVEYLNSQAKFDTVMILFNKAGLLDQLNKQNATVIIPTNYSVNQYVLQIQAQKRIEQNDENLKYTFKDLMNDFDLFKDSLKMYMQQQQMGLLKRKAFWEMMWRYRLYPLCFIPNGYQTRMLS